MGFFDWLMKGIGFESDEDDYDVSKIERKQRKEQKRLEREARKKEAKNKTEPKGLEITAGSNGYNTLSAPTYQSDSYSDSYGQSSYSSNGYGSSSGYDMLGGSVGGYGNKNVVFFYPNSYAEVQQLIDYLKQGESVMLNLDSIASGDAQRMLDFASGAVYALGGCIQQVAPNIFLLTPEGLGIVDPRRGNK